MAKTTILEAMKIQRRLQRKGWKVRQSMSGMWIAESEHYKTYAVTIKKLEKYVRDKEPF